MGGAGTNSYVLFTLDKLIYKMVKQTQLLVTDELALKLLDLYGYEAARTVPHAEAVYRANARVLLHDEPMFQCTSCTDGALTVQLIEADGTEGGPGENSRFLFVFCILLFVVLSGLPLHQGRTSGVGPGGNPR